MLSFFSFFLQEGIHTKSANLYVSFMPHKHYDFCKVQCSLLMSGLNPLLDEEVQKRIQTEEKAILQIQLHKIKLEALIP